WCWGEDDTGQIGNDTIQAYPGGILEPVRVHDLNDAVEVAVGGLFTCARRSNGAVRCWGDNTHGQLGIGEGAAHTAPVADVIGLPEPAIRIEAGFWNACAILQSGGLFCWGNNTYGQLGNGAKGGHTPTASQVLESASVPLARVVRVSIGTK